MTLLFELGCSPLVRITLIMQAYANAGVDDVQDVFLWDIDRWFTTHGVSLDDKLKRARLGEQEGRYAPTYDDNDVPF